MLEEGKSFHGAGLCCGCRTTRKSFAIASEVRADASGVAPALRGRDMHFWRTFRDGKCLAWKVFVALEFHFLILTRWTFRHPLFSISALSFLQLGLNIVWLLSAVSHQAALLTLCHTFVPHHRPIRSSQLPGISWPNIHFHSIALSKAIYPFRAPARSKTRDRTWTLRKRQDGRAASTTPHRGL
jgi:hypothetical protein